MINFEEIWNLTLQKLTKIYVGVFSLSFYVLCKRVVVRRTQLLLGKKSCVPLEPWTHASIKQRERERIYIWSSFGVLETMKKEGCVKNPGSSWYSAHWIDWYGVWPGMVWSTRCGTDLRPWYTYVHVCTCSYIHIK